MRGKERFSATSSFSRIVTLHANVHNSANTNLKYLNEDALNSTLNNATTIINNFDKMEEASNELFSLLDTMLSETKKG